MSGFPFVSSISRRQESRRPSWRWRHASASSQLITEGFPRPISDRAQSTVSTQRLGHQTSGPRSFRRTFMRNYRATSHGRRGLRFQQQIAIGVFDPRQNPQPKERSLGFSAQHYRCPDWFIRHSFVLRHCCSEGRAHQTLRSELWRRRRTERINRRACEPRLDHRDFDVPKRPDPDVRPFVFSAAVINRERSAAPRLL